MTGAVVHIAGVDVRVKTVLRQRCGWCGALLEEYDLDRIQVAVTEDTDADRLPPVWELGALVEKGEGWARVIEHEAGDQLPDNACGSLDPAVSR